MRHSLSTATMLLLQSCALPFPSWQPLDDPPLARELSGAFPDQPPGSRSTVRAIISLDGMELPLTLRIFRLSPDNLRVFAVEDLGGTLFHFVIRGGETSVIARASAIPLEVLVRGVAEDLALWLLSSARDGDRAVRHADGALALLRERGDRQTLFWSSAMGAAIDHIADGRGDRLIREIEMGWEGNLPADAMVINHEMGYTMDLEVREWNPADLTPDRFLTDR